MREKVLGFCQTVASGWSEDNSNTQCNLLVVSASYLTILMTNHAGSLLVKEDRNYILVMVVNAGQ